MKQIESKKLRDSASGQECAFHIVGVCNYDESTTVLAHLPDETKGIARKSDDISAAFACSACHDAIDGRAKSAEFEQFRDWYMRRAQVRTLRTWIEQGLIIISGVTR